MRAGVVVCERSCVVTRGGTRRRMLVVDFLDMRLRVVKLRARDPKCAVCGDAPTITDVTDTCATAALLRERARVHPSWGTL